MKFMDNHDESSSNSINWLGFSLSPHHMKMEINNNNNNQPKSVSSASSSSTSSSSVSSAIPPASLFSYQSHLNYSSYSGSVEGENGGLYSSFPAMPLKSDGSLCIMEALARSQPQATMVTASAPKLEDFFGGATMGTHQYEPAIDRQAMALSLDSMYYHHPHHHHHHHQHQDQVQSHYPYHSTDFRSYEMLVGDQEFKPAHVSPNAAQLSQTINGDDGINGIRNYHAMEQQKMLSNCMGNNVGDSSAISAMAYSDLQSLNLSMSPGSQSSCVTNSQQISPNINTDSVIMETKKRGPDKMDQKQIVHRKSIDTFGQRTSQYRGVTRHRWTGRYEAHLWDNSCKKEGQSRKGRQVYLGGYDMEEKAARAYDLAALKYWGPSTHINFPLENYQKELEEMKNMSRQEYVAHLRRKSSGFSRGASIYRGVTRHHQHGRWQARIGRVAGNKDLYLGTFSTQEEAAEAYDIAAIKFRGGNAVTNFDITRYDVERIMASNALLAGELARRTKETGTSNELTVNHNPSIHNTIQETMLPSIQKSIDNEQSDWKMTTLYHKAQNIIDNYKAQALSMAQETGENIGGNHHMSNASSLVTSLSSSREGSPNKSASNLPMLLAMPVFAAWTDA